MSLHVDAMESPRRDLEARTLVAFLLGLPTSYGALVHISVPHSRVVRASATVPVHLAEALNLIFVTDTTPTL